MCQPRRLGNWITADDRSDIWEMNRELGVTQKDLARRYGVSQSTISRIVRREQRRLDDRVHDNRQANRPK